MISFDLECSEGHRFEGVFRDYDSFDAQLGDGKVTCPFCDTREVKRIFSGCSIQARPVSRIMDDTKVRNMFQAIRDFRRYVNENFENVGRDFPETARAIYYGIEDERPIYGETTMEEVRELAEEGIGVLPIPDVEKLEN